MDRRKKREKLKNTRDTGWESEELGEYRTRKQDCKWTQKEKEVSWDMDEAKLFGDCPLKKKKSNAIHFSFFKFLSRQIFRVE